MRFDAYAASIRDQDLGYVAHCLADNLGGIICKSRQMRRYGEVWDIDMGPRNAAWIGRDQTSGLLYVEGKGESSPQLARTIRVHFPDHTVPRFDVCEDYDEPGAFDALQATVRSHKGPKVKAGYVALPDDIADGKTWSCGVRGGVSYLRIYEKGKQPEYVSEGRPDWARFELECRPHYARDKAAAARMSPVEAFGFSAWSQRVGEAVLQVPIPRFTPEIRAYSYDKTTRYIAKTFRRHFEEMISNGEDVTRTLQGVWEEEDQRALQNRRSPHH